MNTLKIGEQLSFHQCISWMSFNKGAVGALGETLTARALEEYGYKVSTSHHSGFGDLTVCDGFTGELLYVEVKTARQGKDKRYRFCLHKKDQYGQTTHRGTNYVILQCVTKSGHCVAFVIPTSIVRDVKNITISANPRTYAGKYAKYRQTMRNNSLRLEYVQ